MIELVTEAIVTEKIPLREHDAKVFLYTEALGNVIAIATSARKITAKLNAHCEPLNIAIVRLAQRQENETGTFQLSDAMIVDHCVSWRETAEYFRCGMAIMQLLRRQELGNRDAELWMWIRGALRESPKMSIAQYRQMFLAVMGFNPAYATCVLCSARSIAAFDFGDATFYCKDCAPVDAENDMVSMVE